MTDAILAGAVLAAMAGLAVHDAQRALVDPRMVLALLAPPPHGASRGRAVRRERGRASRRACSAHRSGWRR